MLDQRAALLRFRNAENCLSPMDHRDGWTVFIDGNIDAVLRIGIKEAKCCCSGWFGDKHCVLLVLLVSC